MKKKAYSWIIYLVLLIGAIVAVWTYYPQQKENISPDQEKKVKQMLMTSSQHINSGMESVHRIGLKKTSTQHKNK